LGLCTKASTDEIKKGIKKSTKNEQKKINEKKSNKSQKKEKQSWEMNQIHFPNINSFILER